MYIYLEKDRYIYIYIGGFKFKNQIPWIHTIANP